MVSAERVDDCEVFGEGTDSGRSMLFCAAQIETILLMVYRSKTQRLIFSRVNVVVNMPCRLSIHLFFKLQSIGDKYMA